MVRRKSRILSMLLSVVLLFGMIGYINIDNTYAAAKKIHLKKTTVSLIVEKTYQQKLIDKKGKTIKATKVKWKSTKPKIAKIDKKGKIKAVKAGTAKMTAKYKGKTYKFTIKVTKPFKSTAKPANVDVEYYEYGEIGIYWDSLKNAKKYQVYISKNGGAYSRLVTTTNTYYDYTDCKEGVTYSFKIRGICGTYKSAFSKVKSVTIPASAKGNTSISFNTDSVALIKGESETIEIFTDKGMDIAYSVDNSTVSCTWGDWKGNNCDLIVHGDKVGKSILTVYDDNDPSVKAEVEVYVFSYLEMLQYVVGEDGYTNGNGDKTLKYAVDDSTTTYFIDHGSDVEFFFFNNHETSELKAGTMVKMTMELPEDYSTVPEITIEINDYYFTAHAYVTTTDYNESDELYFYRDSGNTPTNVSIQNLCNASFRAAMGAWDLGLKSLVGFSMNDMGFENY